MECVTESHFVAVVTREVTLSLPLLTVASCLSYRGYSRVWERERERLFSVTYALGPKKRSLGVLLEVE